jgi:DNA-directed RNA polymerase specialized sigma24 family protein
MQIPPPRYAPVGMTKVRWNGEYNLAMSILKGTRVQADAIVENFAGGSPVEEIAENFGIPQSTIEELLAFAALKREQFQH